MQGFAQVPLIIVQCRVNTLIWLLFCIFKLSGTFQNMLRDTEWFTMTMQDLFELYTEYRIMSVSILVIDTVTR